MADDADASASSVLPAAVLDQSPSLRAGVAGPMERLHRIFGCEVLQEAGILLELPQVVMVTAQSLLHRFYYRQSLLRFDVFAVAMGSLLLASKVEEQPKLVRDVIFVFYYVYHTRRKTANPKALDIGGRLYSQWKVEVVNMERLILKELGFCLYRVADHPHKYLLYFVRLLGGSNELAQVAWNYLNDSLRLDLCVRHAAKVLAATAIYMAARKIGHPLPPDQIAPVGGIGGGDAPKPWFALLGTDLDTMHDIANAILGLYHEKRLDWVEPLCACEYLADA